MEFHLAPLKNISCWAFRAGIPGATDVYTEMIRLKTIRTNPSNFWKYIDTYGLPLPETKQWVQLLSNNSNDITTLLHEIPKFIGKNPARSHFFGFNLNLGCPDPHIMAEGLGACQMNDLRTVKKIINSFISDDHPYTLSMKIRLGENQQDMAANKFLKLLDLVRSFDDPRLFPTVIHFKHAKQTSAEPCRWEPLEAILDMEMPIIINGQISNLEEMRKIKTRLPPRYLKLWNNYVRGVMVGRGVLDNPFCFEQFNSPPPKKPDKIKADWEKTMSGLMGRYTVEERFKKKMKALYGLTL